jgi:hypothetical protein
MAYYSSSGQKIRQGAAGIGSFFSGQPAWAGAYKDGSLGEYFGGDAPWAGSYKDGSLGRSEGGLNYGPARAFRDGSIGAVEQAAAGVGAAYEQAAAGIGLGYPLLVDGMPVDQPITIYHGPPMSGCTACGQVPYGPLRARKDGVLGAVDDAVNANTLDLQNASALKEMKMAMAQFAPEAALVQTPDTDPSIGNAYFDDAFYASPIWDVKADKLWWICQTKLLAMPNSIYKAPGDITQTKGTHNWPKPAGVAAVSMLGPGNPQQGANYFQTNYPILYAYNQAIQAAGGSLSKFKVTEPFFTQAEVVKGKGFSFAGMGVGALLGLGAVAAVGGFLLLRRK